MVNYTLAQYSGDKDKVFVTGGSSGAMMTNVMAVSKVAPYAIPIHSCTKTCLTFPLFYFYL